MSIPAQTINRNTGIKRSSANPYPDGGYSAPSDVTIPVRAPGDLNMSLSMEIAAAELKGGGHVEITIGSDLRVSTYDAKGKCIQRRSVDINELANAMTDAEIEGEVAPS